MAKEERPRESEQSQYSRRARKNMADQAINIAGYKLSGGTSRIALAILLKDSYAWHPIQIN